MASKKSDPISSSTKAVAHGPITDSVAVDLAPPIPSKEPAGSVATGEPGMLKRTPGRWPSEVIRVNQRR